MKFLELLQRFWSSFTAGLGQVFGLIMIFNHGCSIYGHAFEPIKELKDGKWQYTGMMQCENCSKSKKLLCHDCKEHLKGSNAWVECGDYVCPPCFKKREQPR